ncbi:MAG: hypothetical protein U9Q79_10200 [Candidatus Hydrogenedentes bacterium]|nr:hypothetical protein [Candidatus Hydrogenedentota bacterium]
MSSAIVVWAAVLFVAAAVLVYLTWLLFSRSLPRISKGGAFFLWFWAFAITTTLFLAVVLRYLMAER